MIYCLYNDCTSVSTCGDMIFGSSCLVGHNGCSHWHPGKPRIRSLGAEPWGKHRPSKHLQSHEWSSSKVWLVRMLWLWLRKAHAFLLKIKNLTNLFGKSLETSASTPKKPSAVLRSFSSACDRPPTWRCVEVKRVLRTRRKVAMSQ